MTDADDNDRLMLEGQLIEVKQERDKLLAEKQYHMAKTSVWMEPWLQCLDWSNNIAACFVFCVFAINTLVFSSHVVAAFVQILRYALPF